MTKWIGVKRSQGIMCMAATIGVAVHFLALSFISLGKHKKLLFFVYTFSGEITFITILSIGRLMIGLQAGSSLCLLPLYIIEISPSQYRSFLNNFQVRIQKYKGKNSINIISASITIIRNTTRVGSWFRRNPASWKCSFHNNANIGSGSYPFPPLPAYYHTPNTSLLELFPPRMHSRRFS